MRLGIPGVSTDTMSSRLERLLAIDAYLRRGTYPTVERLCQVFEVQERTIYLDLKELKERFGLDIRFDRGRNGYFNADPDRRLPSLALTDREAALLLAAIELLCQSVGPPVRGALAGVIDMMAELDPQLREAELSEFLTFAHTDTPIKPSLFAEAIRSFVLKQNLSCRYNNGDGPDETITIDFTPKRLEFKNSRWYLVGAAAGDHVELTIPLDAMTSAEMED